MKRTKKYLIISLVSVVIFMGSIFSLNAATATKTKGAVVQSDYIWVMSTLYVDYNTSSKKISGANMKRTYTFLGVTSAKERVTSLKTYSATGKLTATLSGTTKSNTVTITTN